MSTCSKVNPYWSHLPTAHLPSLLGNHSISWYSGSGRILSKGVAIILGYMLHLGEIITLEKSYIGSEKRRKRQSDEQRLSGSADESDGHVTIVAIVRVRVRVRFDGPRTEGPASAISWNHVCIRLPGALDCIFVNNLSTAWSPLSPHCSARKRSKSKWEFDKGLSLLWQDYFRAIEILLNCEDF